MAKISRRSLLTSGTAAVLAPSVAYSQVISSSSNVPNRVISSDDRSVDLLINTDPSFLQQLNAAFPGLSNDPTFNEMLPLAVLLRHLGGPPVKAFTVSWQIVSDGGIYASRFYHAAPVGSKANNKIGFTVITGEVPILVSQGIRLVTPFFSWTPSHFAQHPNPHWKRVLGRTEPGSFMAYQMLTASQVNVSLDAVVFGDFQVYGPDRSESGTRFAVKRNAEHDEGLYVQRLLTKGSSDEEIIKELTDRANAKHGRHYANILWYGNARRHQAAVLATQLDSFGRPTFTKAVARLVAHRKTAVQYKTISAA